MADIQPHGKPESRIWVVVEKQYDNDYQILFSGGYGYHFHKIMADAGINDYYITCYKPDPAATYDDEVVLQDFVSNWLNRYKPPFIIILGEKAVGALLPQTKSFKKPHKARIESFAGSLLESQYLNYEHYCVCSHAPDVIIGHWDYRDIQVFMDFGRVRAEFEYWQKNHKLEPLPSYDITVNPTYQELMERWLLGEFKNAQYLSKDIETIRPRKSSEMFKGNPGFPYLFGLADSSRRGISFSLWNYTDLQAIRIWRAVNDLIRTIPLIGQNFFNFDAHYIEALGFQPNLRQTYDTLIRHHILWPELPHALQFLTKQYTRQPYYKDEGKGFIPKNQEAINKYMHYNALDAVVTYAVFEGQEDEFADRPHLR